MKDNFGETGSEIFENILQGEPRLLSHEILEKNMNPNIDNSKASTLTGVRRDFRKANMVDVDSSVGSYRGSNGNRFNLDIGV
jgi:hypothetical protein